jgi:phosphoribosylamine--glycine ligase
MNIAIIGSGAREHALIDAIASRSASKHTLFCLATTNNPGIRTWCSGYEIMDITDCDAVSYECRRFKADLAIIGPEAPLAAGVGDCLRASGIPVFGPDADLARIETSKQFARTLIDANIPDASPSYRIITSVSQAESLLNELGGEYVIKADGLAGGKGVKVSGDHLHSHAEALGYVKELLADHESCLIEQKLTGQEFSMFTITDGTSFLHLPPVQDHKRIFEGDLGANTGGMGSYSDVHGSLPFLTPDEAQKAREYNQTVIRRLGEVCGKPYRGVLYGGYMVTAHGVKIIEFNARFGDPEAMNLMLLVESDLTQLLEHAAKGTLEEVSDIQFSDRATVCKYAVPRGYPEVSVKGEPVHIPQLPEGCRIFYASVNEKDGLLTTAGSRTLACCAAAPTLKEAEELVEQSISSIAGKLYHRKDIGTQTLIDRKVAMMRELRS